MVFTGGLTREQVVAALERRRWIVTDAARDLGVSRQALYKALTRHGIEMPDRSAALLERFRRVGRRGGRPRKTAAA